ncbi:hypothetical protein K435DRAFT_852934 [Dendrothele bispora CBS 962.96]|uniref:F-box domain-containing protein n=1 Tax=Dendrothele bispora (strain CBS 962.96) TaxID=1314807 RepID=A0A4S8MHW0_DENBC|nr:hypothetical protein K435DRAFT_852934 [Dendrothele bispora CBS 962.96]
MAQRRLLRATEQITDAIAATNQFDKVPTEIILEIFRFACLVLVDDSITAYSRPPAVISISEVCRRWRDILLATPQLWSLVLVAFRFGITEKGHYGIQQWLERSEDNHNGRIYPLDVSVMPDICGPGLDPAFWRSSNQFRGLVPSLLQYRHRWREFRFDHSLKDVCTLVAHPLFRNSGVLDCLEKFVLGASSNHWPDPASSRRFPDPTLSESPLFFPHGDWLFNVGKLPDRAPNLNVMVLRSIGRPTNIIDVVVIPRMSAQLTVLELNNVVSVRYWGPAFVRDLLLSCPALETATFDQVYHGWEPIRTPEWRDELDVVLNLKALDLDLERGGAEWVLANLKLPKLESLHISVITGRSTNDDQFATTTPLFNEILVRLQENSRFPLKKLSLKNVSHLSANYLDQFLRGVNYTLEELCLLNTRDFPLATLVERLQDEYPEMQSLLAQDLGFWLPSPTPVLPKLGYLAMLGYMANPIEAEGIITFVLRRACSEGWTLPETYGYCTPLRQALIGLKPSWLNGALWDRLLEIQEYGNGELRIGPRPTPLGTGVYKLNHYAADESVKSKTSDASCFDSNGDESKTLGNRTGPKENTDLA